MLQSKIFVAAWLSMLIHISFALYPSIKFSLTRSIKTILPIGRMYSWSDLPSCDSSFCFTIGFRVIYELQCISIPYGHIYYVKRFSEIILHFHLVIDHFQCIVSFDFILCWSVPDDRAYTLSLTLSAVLTFFAFLIKNRSIGMMLIKQSRASSWVLLITAVTSNTYLK